MRAYSLATSGSLVAKPILGRPRQITPAQAPLLEAQLRAHPDVTLVAHCQRWHAQQAVQVSTATMSRVIARVGWTWKKQVLVVSEPDETERRQWREAVAALDAQQFVVVDESDPNMTVTPRYGWTPHHERTVGRAPRNSAHNQTLVAAPTPSGVPAPRTLPGALTGDAFVASVAQVLVPTLHPGQLVCIDHLSCHKRAEVEPLLTAVDCQLQYLPDYAPDCMPIAHAVSKLKQQLRHAQARTEEALEAAIIAARGTISASDARLVPACRLQAGRPSDRTTFMRLLQGIRPPKPASSSLPGHRAATGAATSATIPRSKSRRRTGTLCRSSAR